MKYLTFENISVFFRCIYYYLLKATNLKLSKLIVLSLAFIFLLSCGDDATHTEDRTPGTSLDQGLFDDPADFHKIATIRDEDRPHEPFAFRSVLDLQPRVITLALDQNVWAAYSTIDCSLIKVWKGSVMFDGPVYTTKHGPQPLSMGDAFFINRYKSPWKVMNSSGDSLDIKSDYKGHRFVENHVELMYEITGDELPKPIKVYELVEAITSTKGSPLFVRKFTTENVPTGHRVGMMTNASSLVVEQNLTSTGELVNKKVGEITFDEDKTAVTVDAMLMLKSNDVTYLNAKMLSNPIYENENSKEEDVNLEDSSIPIGSRLIAKSDCKTCHNKNLKTVGPSYKMIAEKYKKTPENIAMLSRKIKMGGTGVWGKQVMTPHPDINESDLKNMVVYILDLVPDGEGEEDTAADKGASAKVSEPSNVNPEDLLPGLVVRTYDIPKGTCKMPDLKGKKAVFAGIMPQFSNINGDGFKELEDNFAIVAEGYIDIPDDGEYIIETWSDDGSVVYLDGQLVVDNDGCHGTEGKNTKIVMTKGFHELKLMYYNGMGGKYLSFNWKRPGDDAMTVVPPSALFHDFTKRGSLEGYSLPMAEVSSIPGDGQPLEAVHPSFDLSQARPNTFTPKVGGLDFLDDGRLVVSTWDAAGSVYLIENAQSGDPSAMNVKKIAAGLAEPLGVKVVDNTIYVMQKQEITKLVDNNGDDIIDEYHTLADDWGVSANFHEFGFGLAYKDDHFYATLATAIEPGGASTNPQIKDRGKVIKVNKNTGDLQFVASGLRTPNGVGVGYKGDIYVADNQGDWLPSSKIVRVQEGAWYGSRSVDPEGTANMKETPPVMWLPQDEIGNSPSTPLGIDLGPYKGQMIHGEVTHGGVKRVFVEEVDGVYQGALFRFIQGLEAGINRMVWGPDKALYVGGIGNPGNWGQSGKLRYGLQRLAYNGKTTFEMLAVRAKANGFEIEYTEPIQAGTGWDPKGYEVQQWYYKPTIDYGGPKMDLSSLKVKSATVSDDRKKVFIEVPGLKAGHMQYIRLKGGFLSESGKSIWSPEAWYNMNVLPSSKGEVKPSPYRLGNNILTATEKEQGWQLLFDGKKIDQFRNFKEKTVGSSWVIDDESIHLASVKEEGKWQAKDGGDIITDKEYENFEFKIDWKISNCGNSGIIFNVVEDEKYDYVWQTGPEMQVLDNTCHPDSRFTTHKAGDLYDMIETKFPTVRPAGEWNNVMIRSKDGKVDFYLNGYKVVDFQMHNDEWKKRIAESKFKDMPDFGLAKKGHISLQDHGDKVWFRNIKIREI